MDNTREKLIELVGQVQDCGCDVTDVVEMNYVENITLVDHLIANGVVISKKETPTNADRCVCCGAIIPEGQMVCPNCLVTVKEG